MESCLQEWKLTDDELVAILAEMRPIVRAFAQRDARLMASARR